MSDGCCFYGNISPGLRSGNPWGRRVAGKDSLRGCTLERFLRCSQLHRGEKARALRQTLGQSDDGPLHPVGAAALNRRVNQGAEARPFGGGFREEPAATQAGPDFGHALLSLLAAAPVPPLQPGVGAEEGVTESLTLVGLKRHPVGGSRVAHETGGALTIKQSEGHGFRGLSLLFADGFRCGTQHGGGGERVEIRSGSIRLKHLLLASDGGSDAEFHLGVVCDDEEVARRGNKGLAQFTPPDVLEIRLLRREAPGGGAGRLEAGMDAAIFADVLEERLGLLRPLAGLAMGEDQGDDAPVLRCPGDADAG